VAGNLSCDAALEIVETPPSPVGRATGVTVIAVFCLALLWASFGTVDIVATAPGKIVPSGRANVIQPFETGVVRAIHVRDGQKVKAGEVLIELEPTMTDAERDHLRSDLLSSQMEVARLRAAVSGGSDPTDAFVRPEGASSSMIEMNRQLLISQVAEHQGKLAALDRQVKQGPNGNLSRRRLQSSTRLSPFCRKKLKSENIFMTRT
jgi:membrane fusion protein, hemolysin D